MKYKFNQAFISNLHFPAVSHFSLNNLYSKHFCWEIDSDLLIKWHILIVPLVLYFLVVLCGFVLGFPSRQCLISP